MADDSTIIIGCLISFFVLALIVICIALLIIQHRRKRTRRSDSTTNLTQYVQSQKSVPKNRQRRLKVIGYLNSLRGSTHPRAKTTAIQNNGIITRLDTTRPSLDAFQTGKDHLATQTYVKPLPIKYKRPAPPVITNIYPLYPEPQVSDFRISRSSYSEEPLPLPAIEYKNVTSEPKPEVSEITWTIAPPSPISVDIRSSFSSTDSYEVEKIMNVASKEIQVITEISTQTATETQDQSTETLEEKTTQTEQEVKPYSVTLPPSDDDKNSHVESYSYPQETYYDQYHGYHGMMTPYVYPPDELEMYPYYQEPDFVPIYPYYIDDTYSISSASTKSHHSYKKPKKKKRSVIESVVKPKTEERDNQIVLAEPIYGRRYPVNDILKSDNYTEYFGQFTNNGRSLAKLSNNLKMKNNQSKVIRIRKRMQGGRDAQGFQTRSQGGQSSLGNFGPGNYVNSGQNSGGNIELGNRNFGPATHGRFGQASHGNFGRSSHGNVQEILGSRNRRRRRGSTDSVKLELPFEYLKKEKYDYKPQTKMNEPTADYQHNVTSNTGVLQRYLYDVNNSSEFQKSRSSGGDNSEKGFRFYKGSSKYARRSSGPDIVSGAVNHLGTYRPDVDTTNHRNERTVPNLVEYMPGTNNVLSSSAVF